MVSRIFTTHPHIRVREAIGDPPERYRIEYLLRGLVMQNDAVVEKDSHLVEIFLTLGYPRQAPQCRMLSPVFHPNIAPHAVCIGDHWSAGESLAALILRIGEMITFQSYNTKSPLNGVAARWVEEHIDRLPMQRVDLTLDGAEADTPAVQPGPPPPVAGPTPSGVEPSPPAPAIRESTRAATDFRVYTPAQVLFVSFLASALCGCWLLSRNFRRFGDRKQSTVVLIGGVVATTVQAFLAALPRSTSLVFPIALAAGLYQYANRVQGSRIDEHLALGGRRESWWKTIGTAILFVLGFLALATLVSIVLGGQAPR